MLHCSSCNRYFTPGISTCPVDGTTLQGEATHAEFAAAFTDSLVGRVFDDKYRLEELLGAGGMGTVYRATHLLIDRPVALKILHPAFVENQAARQRFQREARAAGRLQHANAVAVTDFGQTSDGYVYLVMELLEGRDLSDMLVLEAPLEPAFAVALISRISAAVAAAHAAGVIHRDLKPSNIYLTERAGQPPVVKVLDFGIAKLAETREDMGSTTLTQTGVMIGTPRYMSPEQCDGEHLTPASDVYSLGIILYEMLTGATPFNGATPLAIALQHSAKPPRPPRELVPAIPEELERVVLHALAKDPAERPADAGEFRRELLETAERLGLDLTTAGSPARPDGPADNGEGATAPEQIVIDLEKMRAERAAAAESVEAGGKTNETTLPADAFERARLAAQAERARHAESGAQAGPPATAAAAGGSAIANLFPLRTRAFTRFQVLLHGRPIWLQAVAQPPVLITVALTLLVVAVSVVGLVKSRGEAAAVAPVENASAMSAPASPQPSPEASVSPTPEAASARKQPARGRRATNRTANRQRKSGGNPVKKALKKIFKNPF